MLRGGEFAETRAKGSTNRNKVGMASTITADWATQEGGLKRNDTNQNFLKDAEIGFAEMNSVRIIRGIFNKKGCNPILVVPPNAIINPKKA